MRIGTWNLDAKTSSDHLRIIDELLCDVWLLTEVPAALSLSGGAMTVSPRCMSRGQHFAAVWSRGGGQALDAPSPATAATRVDAVSFYSSVLPWRTCAPDWPWHDGDQASRTVDTVDSLDRAFTCNVVWGGDWNQTLTGPNHGGTRIGRAAIEDVMTRHRLVLPTRDLPHRSPGMAAIDHLAVPDRWTVTNAERVPVPDRLSDHDVYIVDVQPI